MRFDDKESFVGKALKFDRVDDIFVLADSNAREDDIRLVCLSLKNFRESVWLKRFSFFVINGFSCLDECLSMLK